MKFIAASNRHQKMHPLERRAMMPPSDLPVILRALPQLRLNSEGWTAMTRLTQLNARLSRRPPVKL